MSLARPGKNVTGLSSFAPELVGKQLQLLQEVVPGLSRVAVLCGIRRFHAGARVERGRGRSAIVGSNG